MQIFVFIDIFELRRKWHNKHSFELVNYLDNLQEELIKRHGLRTYGNVHFCTGRYYPRLKFVVTKMPVNCSLFSIWSIDSIMYGNRSVTVLDDEFFTWLDEIITDNDNNIYRCTKCGRKFPLTEAAGYFYAGVYCTDCWEGGIKQMAANENYD